MTQPSVQVAEVNFKLVAVGGEEIEWIAFGFIFRPAMHQGICAGFSWQGEFIGKK